MIKSLSRAALVAAAMVSCAVVGAANAATISATGVDVLPETIFMPAATGNTNFSLIGAQGSLASTYRSPFAVVNSDPQQFKGDGGSNDANFYKTATYNTAGDNIAKSGSITHSFSGGSQALAFIWGSPDTYNLLTLKDINGNTIDTFTGADIVGPGTFAIGNVAVKILSDVAFYTAIFSSTGAAFEYANLFAAPPGVLDTPLPSALILFGSALVGLTMLGRRRRAANSAAV